jgi:glutathione S-transferase
MPYNGSVITVHHLNNSRSQRVLWLLEELGVPYDVKRYERDPETMLAPAALTAVHPLGKSPVVDGAVTVAESGAIVEYLVDKYGGDRLRPAAATAERLRYTYWLHYAEGSVVPPLLPKLMFDRVATAQRSFIGPQLKRHLDYIEAELAAHSWLPGGEFTAADVQMNFPLEAAVSRAGLDASHPRTMTFLNTVHARDAYRRALERGGPYAYSN